MKTSKLFLALGMILLISCQETKAPSQQIIVKNTLNTDRAFETVAIDLEAIEKKDDKGAVVILDALTKTEVVSQEIDTDGDGIMDQILFQPEIRPIAKRSLKSLLPISLLSLTLYPLASLGLFRNVPTITPGKTIGWRLGLMVPSRKRWLRMALKVVRYQVE